MGDQTFRQIAGELGLDLNRFEADMKDLKTVVRVNQDIRLGAYLGVRGTPSVFINGRGSRARTLEAFQTEVETELERAGKNSAVKGEKKG